MERVCKKCKKPLSAYDKKDICQSCQTKEVDTIKKVGEIALAALMTGAMVIGAIAKVGDIMNSNGDGADS